MHNRLKIALISHSAGLGGAERVLLEMVDALRLAGATCFVVVPSDGPLRKRLAEIGVVSTVLSYPLWASRSRISTFHLLRTALSSLYNAALLAIRLKRWEVDLVISNTVTVGVGALAALLIRRPHVWHIQEFGSEDHGLSFIFGEEKCLTVMGSLSARCLCLSEALATKYRRFINPSKIEVLYPSMHLAFPKSEGILNRSVERATAERRFRCVIAGTLVEGKGQEDSVLAFADLTKAHIDAELYIVGDGIPSYRAHLEKLIRYNDLEGRVVMTGKTDNALPQMQAADAVLVCSRHEGFGRVTVEGMLAAKPVIGARVAATAELIKDGITGLHYSAADHEDLASKIRFLYENPSVAAQIAQNGHEWVREYFTLPRYTADLLSLLEPLVL